MSIPKTSLYFKHKANLAPISLFLILVLIYIHSGSRNIGLKLAIYFQDLAIKKNCYGSGELKQLSYITDKDAQDYLICAEYCREYANLNRKIIAHDIMVGMR